MTTVVATRTALYSDSRCSFGPAHFTSKKLFKVGKSIFGFSGSMTDSLKFIQWAKDRDQENIPEFFKEESFDVLEVSPEGIFVWDNELVPMEILDPWATAGSGHMAALAALHLGSSPEVAIETACKVDRASGGPLQVLHLSQPHNGKPTNNPKGADSSPRARSRTPKK